MNRIFLLPYFTLLFFSASSISQKKTKESNVIITQNLAVNGNMSLLTSANFTDTLTINPLNFQGNLNINGKIFLASNMISIGNDLSNTIFIVKNLDIAPTAMSLYYIMIDLDSSGLFLIPMTEEKLTFADSQNYRVQTLQTNILTTNMIQSQLIPSNEKAIIIGNPTSSLTLQGETLFLNAEQDMTTSSESNLVITSDIATTDIHLEAGENTINSVSVNQNIYGISDVTINNQGEQNNFLVNTYFKTEYGKDNIINLSAKVIKCITSSPDTMQIRIGMDSENNKIVFTNVSEESTDDLIFLLLNNNDNTLSSTLLFPSYENVITPIATLPPYSFTIENLVQCGNNSSSLTLQGNAITVPNTITTVDSSVLKNYNFYLNDNEIKILDYQIEELLKKIIAKHSLLEKNPKLKEKLNFFLKERAKNE